MSRFFLLRILNVISGICSRQMAFSLITSKRRRTVLHYISKTGQLNQNHQGLTFQRRLLQSTFHEERVVEFTEIKCLQHLVRLPWAPDVFHRQNFLFILGKSLICKDT